MQEWAVSGEFSYERLVIDADGDNTNVDAVVVDQLRTYTMIVRIENELNIFDNGVSGDKKCLLMLLQIYNKHILNEIVLVILDF